MLGVVRQSRTPYSQATLLGMGTLTARSQQAGLSLPITCHRAGAPELETQINSANQICSLQTLDGRLGLVGASHMRAMGPGQGQDRLGLGGGHGAWSREKQAPHLALRRPTTTPGNAGAER